MKKYWIVWNAQKSEGVVFDNLRDAKHAAGVERMRQMSSAIGDTFNEYYGDEGELVIQEVKL